MPIASLKPTAEVPVIQNNEPKVQPECFTSTIVNTSNNKTSSLLAYIGGMPWNVTYYQQVIATHSDLKEQDFGELPLYQQYNKINLLELRVTENISGEQNTDLAQMRVSGSALVYPFFTPQTGDMFVAEAGLGQQGIYVIDSTERKSFNLQTVYAINYHLVVFTSQAPSRLEDLDAKTIRELYFDKSRMAQGLAPVLNNEDYNNLQDLSGLYSKLVNYYVETFFHHNYDTLILPGQTCAVYDAFVVDYFLKIVNTDDALKIADIRQYATDGDVYLAQPQFWTMLLNRDFAMLDYINRYMGLVSIRYFNDNSFFKGFRFSRLNHVVYPTNADFSLEHNHCHLRDNTDYLTFQAYAFSNLANQSFLKPKSGMRVRPAKSNTSHLSALVEQQEVGSAPDPQYIKSAINEDESYVFSPAFYSGEGTLSILEALVTDYLKINPLNLDDLTQCAKQYVQWGRLEQFYYIPILITLINCASKEACQSWIPC